MLSYLQSPKIVLIGKFQNIRITEHSNYTIELDVRSNTVSIEIMKYSSRVLGDHHNIYKARILSTIIMKPWENLVPIRHTIIIEVHCEI